MSKKRRATTDYMDRDEEAFVRKAKKRMSNGTKGPWRYDPRKDYTDDIQTLTGAKSR